MQQQPSLETTVYGTSSRVMDSAKPHYVPDRTFHPPIDRMKNMTPVENVTQIMADNTDLLSQVEAVTQAEVALTLLLLVSVAIIWSCHGWRTSGGWGMLLVYVCSQVVGGCLKVQETFAAQGEAIQNICMPIILIACVGIICEA